MSPVGVVQRVDPSTVEIQETTPCSSTSIRGRRPIVGVRTDVCQSTTRLKTTKTRGGEAGTITLKKRPHPQPLYQGKGRKKGRKEKTNNAYNSTRNHAYIARGLLNLQTTLLQTLL